MPIALLVSLAAIVSIVLIGVLGVWIDRNAEPPTSTMDSNKD